MKSDRKHKTGKLGKIVAQCSEERILQLSNDVSENIASGELEEWRAVAVYWRDRLDALQHRLDQLQSTIAVLCLSRKMETLALVELQRWQDEHYPPIES